MENLDAATCAAPDGDGDEQFRPRSVEDLKPEDIMKYRIAASHPGEYVVTDGVSVLWHGKSNAQAIKYLLENKRNHPNASIISPKSAVLRAVIETMGAAAQQVTDAETAALGRS